MESQKSKKASLKQIKKNVKASLKPQFIDSGISLK